MGDALPKQCKNSAGEGTFFFSNKACSHFPCHAGIDPERFNCMFCYCPLYPLGDSCGGNFQYTSKGYKDCSQCTIMHDGERGADLVNARYLEISLIAWENHVISRAVAS